MKSQVKQTLLLFLIFAITPLSGVGVDIYTPSLPNIVPAFHTSISLAKNTITAYLIGSLLGSFLAGPLSDSFGRRKTALLSLFCFSVFSLLATWSPSIDVFSFFRVLQGACISITVVAIRAFIAEYYEESTLRKVSAYMVIAWSIGPIVAPVIGGYLQHYIGWKGSFYFLTLYALLFSGLAWIYLPETLQKKALFSIKTIFTNYIHVVTKSRIVVYACCNGMAYALIIVFSVTAPFFIQRTLGYSAIDFGHIALFIGLGCLLGGLLNRAVTHSFSKDAIIHFGIALALLSALALLVTAFWWPRSLLCLVSATFINLFVVGLIYPEFISRAIRACPEMGGVTNSIAVITTFACTILSSSSVSLFRATQTTPIALSYIACVLILTLFQWISIRKPVH